MVDVGYFWGGRASKAAGGLAPAPSRGAAGPITANSAPLTADFSDRQIALLFILLAGISSIPVLLYPWPPLTDYMNHLSRMHVIATIDGDPDLARFYEVNWQIIPNLMMDLVVPVLERIMNVYIAGQVFTIASFMLILSGAMALNRRLYGQWSILPLIAFPLLYNNVFLVGTMNYVFGIGLSLWALVAWVWLRERGLLLRLTVSTLFVLGLFFCHLFAVGLYGLGLFAYELHRLGTIWLRRPRPWPADPVRRRRGFALFDFVAGGLPFLPVLPLLMMSPTWGLRASFEWELAGKLDGLIYVVEVYSKSAAFALIAIVAFAAGWGIRHRALMFHPFGWVLLLVGSITYLAMPRMIFETYMADQRLPISLAFMLIACAHLNLRHDYVRRGFAIVLVLLVSVRVLEVQGMWSDLSATTASFHESVRHIDRGSKVLVAYSEPDGGDDARDQGLMHAATLAIIERSALVTTAFTVVGKQILHVRDDYRARVDTEDGTPPTISQLVQAAEQPSPDRLGYWERWRSDYDYLYVLFTAEAYENPAPTLLTPLYVGERFVLYRINNTTITVAGDPQKQTEASPLVAGP